MAFDPDAAYLAFDKRGEPPGSRRHIRRRGFQMPAPAQFSRAALAALLTTLIALSFAVAPARAEPPRAVVELFTSQGCSSCPPADRLMGELVRRGDLVTLTYPVDYWDYLGWHDTLASPENSRRQRDYAEARGDRAVYTPQVVVNGATHVVGSDRKALGQALETSPALPVKVSLRRIDERIEISVEGRLPAGTGMATVMVAFVAPPVDVAIPRGENRGRNITYHHVVKAMRAVGVWEGGKAVFQIPASEIRKLNAGGCAALVQIEKAGRPGRILGAGTL
jgi:hypothetical protein